MKYRLITGLLLIFCQFKINSQSLFTVEGNGLFTSPASTNVDIKNTDDNTNALIRFGDNNQSKVSLGFNGNEDLFKISTATTLGVEDFTMDLNGLIGINSVPGNPRVLINHNSTSGTGGSAHLTLQESNTTDFSRLRFENLGANGLWTIATRATDGDALMNIFYNDGSNFANIMSFDGDLFRVGIHETAPEAYLHIKQKDEGVPALILQNDDQTGGEKWSMVIGDDDLEFHFEGEIRGSFSAATGAYTAFPPSLRHAVRWEEAVLDQVLQLNPVSYSFGRSKNSSIALDPVQVASVNPGWVRRSNDGQAIGVNYQEMLIRTIKAFQEQQDLIVSQQYEIHELEQETNEMLIRLKEAEAKMAQLLGVKGQ